MAAMPRFCLLPLEHLSVNFSPVYPVNGYRNHIRNLRRKLEINPDYPAIIQSRHGRGYSIQTQVKVQESQQTG